MKGRRRPKVEEDEQQKYNDISYNIIFKVINTNLKNIYMSGNTSGVLNLKVQYVQIVSACLCNTIRRPL